MTHRPALILTAAAALTLTACAPPAPTETTAQVACEELVTDAVPAPGEPVFEHDTTTRDGERWDLAGTARGGTLAGPLVYHCAVSFEDDGQHYRGHVWFSAEPFEGGDRP